MILGPGDMFGELSLFDSGPRTASAIAVTDSKVLALGQEKVIPWVREHPEVSLQLLARLATRLRRTNEVVGDLVFSDVPGRVAKALIDLGVKFGEKREEEEKSAQDEQRDAEQRVHGEGGDDGEDERAADERPTRRIYPHWPRRPGFRIRVSYPERQRAGSGRRLGSGSV